MINSASSSSNSWLPPHNIVDSLNQVMDSVSVLSDVELQKELSIFANAQFTYDIAPGVAVDDDKNELNNSQQRFRQESKQLNMHSLLNVKLASLAKNNYHTTMTPDAIESYYDQSPDCSPPNGYHSPNPSPPNGYHSPNPTPPNGYHANSHGIFNGIQGIVNPPITYYGEDTVTGYDEDQFMKTMRILSTNYNDPNQQLYDHLDSRSSSIFETNQPTAIKKQRNNSISSSAKKSTLAKADLSVIDSEDEEDEEDEDIKKNSPLLTKEDKRRRNTAASARFRVKKKLREQALQQTADEMTEKAKVFENRVHELEREVKWLKALIVEKKDGHLEQLLMQQQHRQLQHHEVNHRQYSSVNHHASSAMNNVNYMSLDRHQQQQLQQLQHHQQKQQHI